MRKDIGWTSDMGSSAIMDLRDRNILRYPEDMEEIHDRFGGKCYYQSCTGSNGAGYLDRSLSHLVRLGTYRWNVVPGVRVHFRVEGDVSIWVPVCTAGEPVPWGAPAIILHGGEEDPVVTLLPGWGRMLKGSPDEEGKVIEDVFYDPDGKKVIRRWVLRNPRHLRGINAGAFVPCIELDITRKKWEAIVPRGWDGEIHERSVTAWRTPLTDDLGLFRLGSEWWDEDRYAILHGEDCRLYFRPEEWGEVKEIGPWSLVHREGTREVWRSLRNGNFIFLAVDMGAPEEVDASQAAYHFIVSAADVALGTDGVIITALANLDRAMRGRLMDAKRDTMSIDDLISKMKESTATISVEDSIDAGNCPPGTEAFRNQYRLPEKATLFWLSQHRDIVPMLATADFRRLVVAALAKEE